MLKRVLLAATSLAYAGPALSLDLQSTTAPGRAVPSLSNGEIAINRADRTLFFKKADGTIGRGALMDATPAGRLAVEQDNASILNVKLPDAAAVARTLADMARDRPSVKSYGAKCDGVTDDSAAFNTAAATGLQIYVPPGTCRIASFSIPSKGGAFIGAGRSVTTLKLITPAGADAITVNGPGGYNPQQGNWTTVIRDMTIDGSEATAMTGRAIACQGAAGLVVERVLFRKVPNFYAQSECIFGVALDVAGFDLKAATGIGFDIDGGSFFGDRLFYQNTIPGGLNFDAAAWMQVRQTFGVFLGAGIISHVRRGLYVAVPAGKFAEYSTIGPIQFDQNSVAGIDLFANGGVIRGWQFLGTWSATAASNIQMRVANGGVIYRPELIGVRAPNGMNTNLSANGVTELKVLGGNFSGAGYVFTGTCTTAAADNSVTITGGFEFNTVMGGRSIVIGGTPYTINNIITGTKAGLTTAPGDRASPVACSFTSDTQTNIAIGGASVAPSLVGVTAGKDTYAPGKPSVGIFLDAGIDKPILVENDVSGVPNGLVSARTSAWSEAHVLGNRGADTAYPTIASAATLPLTFAKAFTMSGTTGVTAISGPAWPGRQITVIPTGVLTFTAGSTIGNTFTTKALEPFTATFAEGRWFLK